MTYDITSLLPPPETPISQLSRSQAAALLLHRKQIRRDLRAWCIEALAPLGFKPARHHELLLGELAKVAAGETERLMVLMPPGSAKSTYASILFPAWYFANCPADAMIAASHTASLAERFGRRVRNIIAEHGPTLGIELAPDIKAAGQWETTAGGEYYAAGVDGPIAGRRADIAIIDDPVKSRQDADSATISERNWEWWKNDLVPRLKPNGRVILIMTRWSEIDLGGRLLDDVASGGRPWKVLRLPMEAEPGDSLGRVAGEPLWPEWFTASQRIEAKRDSRSWSALYQQSPAPAEGIYFSHHWLHPSISVPMRDSLRIYGASDYAVTDDGGDYTVHVVVGIDPDNRLWLLDLWRAQVSSDVWIETFCDLVKQWKPIGWAEESGQIKAGVGPFLTRRMRERQANVARADFPSRADKSVRAQSIRGRMATNGLYYLADAPWRASLESELLSFPAGKHDDQVDALGLIGQVLDRMVTPERPVDLDLPMRSAADMTITEAWKHADPRARVGRGRI